MLPLVSIIISCYNKEIYLSDTLKSVLAQSFQNFEVIVVDDASTDQSTKIIKEYQLSEKRISLLPQTVNRGANFCRNFGLQNSKADWVIFLDADDLLTKDCLKRRIDVVRKGEWDLAIFPLRLFNRELKDDDRMWQPSAKKAISRFLSHDLPWQTMQPIWKKDFLVQIGGFDSTFERLQDVELHTRALLQPGVKFKVYPGKPDCFFRIDEERKNFRAAEFLGRWVRSAVKYYNKFYLLVPRGMRKYLLGTVYKAQTQLAHHFRKAEITQQEYEALAKELASVLDQTEIPAFKKRLFEFAGFYKTKLPRVPGVNRVLEALLIYL